MGQCFTVSHVALKRAHTSRHNYDRVSHAFKRRDAQTRITRLTKCLSLSAPHLACCSLPRSYLSTDSPWRTPFGSSLTVLLGCAPVSGGIAGGNWKVIGPGMSDWVGPSVVDGGRESRPGSCCAHMAGEHAGEDCISRLLSCCNSSTSVVESRCMTKAPPGDDVEGSRCILCGIAKKDACCDDAVAAVNDLPNIPAEVTAAVVAEV